MANKDKKLKKQKKREKKKRMAKDNRPGLETHFSESERKKGMIQIGIVLLIMVAASLFIFSKMS